MRKSKKIRFDTGQSIQMTMQQEPELLVNEDDPLTTQQSTTSEVPDSVLEPEDAGSDAFFYMEYQDTSLSQSDDKDWLFTKSPATQIESPTVDDELKPIIKEEVFPGKAQSIRNIESDSFAQDLAEILDGQKEYQAVYPAERPADDHVNSSTPKEKPEVVLTPGEHTIFEKLAQSMRFAEAYNLGNFTVAKQLDAFDQEDTKTLPKTNQPGPVTQPPTNETQSQFNPVDEMVMDQDLDEIMQLPTTDLFDPSRPLTPGNGGRLVTQNDLIQGDLIVYTSGTALKAALYVQSGKIISGAGPLKPVQGVILRHDQMSPEKSTQLASWIEKNTPAQEDAKEVLVKFMPVQISPAVCNKHDTQGQLKCRSFAGRIDFGAPGDDVQVSKYIFDALDVIQLSVVTSKPDWSQTQLLSLVSNGTMKYAGHIKL